MERLIGKEVYFMKGTLLTNIALGGVIMAVGSGILAVNIIALLRRKRVRGC